MNHLQITNEMKNEFHRQLELHVVMIRSRMYSMMKILPQYKHELHRRMFVHDLSKLTDEEQLPGQILYAWKRLNPYWKPSLRQAQAMLYAIHKHVTTETHHPEYYDKLRVPAPFIPEVNIPTQPKTVIDATTMPDIDIIEMVCDWCAASEERGGSAYQWAIQNINKRWKFNEHQTELIYQTISQLES